MKKLTANFMTIQQAQMAKDIVASQIRNPRLYDRSSYMANAETARFAQSLNPSARRDYVMSGQLIDNSPTQPSAMITSITGYDADTRHIDDCTVLEVEADESEYERICQMLYANSAVFVDISTVY